MHEANKVFRFAIALAGIILVFILAAGAYEAGQHNATANNDFDIEDTTDQLQSRDVSEDTIKAFFYEDRLLTVPQCYELALSSDTPWEDGKFYDIVADVSYLDGGVAGYVGFPQIKRVHQIDESEPDMESFPSIQDGTTSGLVDIRGYADRGELLLNENGRYAVWEQGAWIWRYDSTGKLADGTAVLRNDKVGDDEIVSGIGKGILASKDYFVLSEGNTASGSASLGQ